MELSDLKDKKILVVGLGITGISLCKFLEKNGAQVTVSDHKSKAELADYMEQIEDLNITFDLGGHSPKTFLQQELIILSPGISPQLKIFEYASNHGVKVTGEFEFASQFVKEPVIAITGTNGKTTVTKLTNMMLKESGVKTWVGGNYGTPLTEYVLAEDKADVIIAEVSSFQLEHVMTFAPKNIVFTNLAEDHFDRYKTMEEYVNAKRRVFLNTNQNTTSVLNADDNAIVELARDPSVQRGRIFYFSRKEALEPQIMNIGGAVQVKDAIKLRTGPDIDEYSIKDVRFKGVHNVENLMSAMLVAKEHGASQRAIQAVINSFRGLPHRLEYVRKVGGVQFFNDSKATNVHAVRKALDSFDENVILIMGGKDTNLNYTPLQEIIRRKVKNLILVGEAKEKINRDVGDYSETFIMGTFEEAVLVSFQKSRIGDKVLLSPGASSFDIFDSYVERGNYFKDIVNKFKS